MGKKKRDPMDRENHGYEVLSMIPADGWAALFEEEDEEGNISHVKLPLIGWAVLLVEERGRLVSGMYVYSRDLGDVILPARFEDDFVGYEHDPYQNVVVHNEANETLAVDVRERDEVDR